MQQIREDYKNIILESNSISKDITHSGAKRDSLHRWFPYLEGFSERFIESILKGINKTPTTIYEPFAGTGTVPVFSKRNSINTVYSEVNPFLQELIYLKLDVLSLNEQKKKNSVEALTKITCCFSKELGTNKKHKDLEIAYKSTFEDSVYFDDENFADVLKFKTFVESQQDPLTRQFLKIAGCEALLPSSKLKRAGDVRYKKGAKEIALTTNFAKKVQQNLLMMIEDLKNLTNDQKEAKVSGFSNAKEDKAEFYESVDCVITSPPYLNGKLRFPGFPMPRKIRQNFMKVLTA